MVVHKLMRHHRGIQHNVDAPFRVIDQPEGRDRARLDTQNLLQELRLSERQPPRPDLGRGRLQVDLRLLQADDQPDVALVVLQKQVLAVSAGDFPPQGLGLLHGVDGGMVTGRGLDTEGLETGKKVFAGRGHGGQISLVKD